MIESAHNNINPCSSSGQGRLPFKEVTRVRVPYRGRMTTPWRNNASNCPGGGMVDTATSKAAAARREGSTPSWGTVSSGLCSIFLT